MTEGVGHRDGVTGMEGSPDTMEAAETAGAVGTAEAAETAEAEAVVGRAVEPGLLWPV